MLEGKKGKEGHGWWSAPKMSRNLWNKNQNKFQIGSIVIILYSPDLTRMLSKGEITSAEISWEISMKLIIKNLWIQMAFSAFYKNSIRIRNIPTFCSTLFVTIFVDSFIIVFFVLFVDHFLLSIHPSSNLPSVGAVEARTFHTRYRIKEPQAEMTNEYMKKNLCLTKCPNYWVQVIQTHTHINTNKLNWSDPIYMKNKKVFNQPCQHYDAWIQILFTNYFMWQNSPCPFLSIIMFMIFLRIKKDNSFLLPCLPF